MVQAVPPEAIIREDSGAVRPEATDSVAAAEGEAVDSAGDAEVATGLEGTGEAEEAPEAADPEAEVVQVDGEAVAASVAPAVAGEWAEDRDKKERRDSLAAAKEEDPADPRDPGSITTGDRMDTMPNRVATNRRHTRNSTARVKRTAHRVVTEERTALNLVSTTAAVIRLILKGAPEAMAAKIIQDMVLARATPVIPQGTPVDR